MSAAVVNKASSAKKRPCPRGSYDGCPIPRELCTADYAKTGEWHCLDHLKDFERFVFSTDEEGDEEGAAEVVSMEDLLRLLQDQAGGA